MSNTKRNFEKMVEQTIDNWIDADYQYQLWKDKQIIMFEELNNSRDEDYWAELNDERFQRDLEDYYECRYNHL